MKAEQRLLGRLSHEVLFRMVVNRLWIEYDHGGISHRRSYQATLIEGFMCLFPLDEPNYRMRGDIYKEIRSRVDKYLHAQKPGSKFRKRNRQHYVQLELPFADLSVLSNIEFALLSLEASCHWFQNEARKSGFLYRFPGVISEWLRLLCEICYGYKIRRRVPLDITTKEAIVLEGDDRNELKVLADRRLEDFERLGINPWNDNLSK